MNSGRAFQKGFILVKLLKILDMDVLVNCRLG
jgi:hypothetical protein